ncbi:hypothetical protein ANCDUO_03956 [Ancylostoma duodenale]|uniref:Uncharacterized protein n=1 Tax=Ancylostoma duodenale TaxID=51022 RepID=A0A0C2D7T1_9BILA|nr:hypothetical protein ANCDUO_03956 [Ancylostoma duodenale]
MMTTPTRADEELRQIQKKLSRDGILHELGPIPVEERGRNVDHNTYNADNQIPSIPRCEYIDETNAEEETHADCNSRSLELSLQRNLIFHNT